jgi:hypothetical protein
MVVGEHNGNAVAVALNRGCPVCCHLPLVDFWNHRAPLSVSDALTMPEVRALVDFAQQFSFVDDSCDCGLCAALAPFLAAMKKEKT